MRISDWSSEVCSSDLSHSAAVDDPQPDSLTGREQEFQVVRGRVAVDEEGIGRAVDVGNVARVHAHATPADSFGQRHLARGCRLLGVVEVAFGDLGVTNDLVRMERDRKSVLLGKSVSVRVDLGGSSNLKK